MQKVFFQEPQMACHLLDRFLHRGKLSTAVFGENAESIFSQIKQVRLIVDDNTYDVGSIAKYWFQEISQLSCDLNDIKTVDFLSRKSPETLFIVIAKSDNIEDTLSLLKTAKRQGFFATLLVCETAPSSLLFEADFSLTEIQVEKHHLNSLLLVLAFMSLMLSRSHAQANIKELITIIHGLPLAMERTLLLAAKIKDLLSHVSKDKGILFFSPCIEYPVALSGILALKNMEGMLVDIYSGTSLSLLRNMPQHADLPIILLLPDDEYAKESQKFIQMLQVEKRKLIIFADENINFPLAKDTLLISMPEIDEFIAPFIYSIPLRLLGHYLFMENNDAVENTVATSLVG